VRVGPLEAELARTAGTELVLSAPCAGTVVRLHVRGADAVVREGEVLGEVACAGSALRADVMLPAAGVPLVQRGQVVKLFYDAFPFQRYGVRWGTVRWSGPASGGGVAADSAAFRALVDVEDRPVMVRGRPRPLMVGMGGQARVIVERRSLISYAFEPIRELRENLAARPER
jgi:multidrug efflux pump subunit AcrA (membrane-fusion protein)